MPDHHISLRGKHIPYGEVEHVLIAEVNERLNHITVLLGGYEIVERMYGTIGVP